MLSQNYNYDTQNPTKRDHIYIHMSLINDSNTEKIPCQLNYNRNSDIIDYPHLYKIAISKFDISTLDLPLVLPKILIDGNNTDVNKLAYSFTLKYQTNEVQKYVQFKSQNNSPTPTSNGVLTVQDVTTDYYYVNSFQYFINLLNETLKSAYDDLDTAVGGLSSHAPFLSYSDGLLIMNADVSKYDNAINNPIYIYCNSAMYELLNGFLTSASTDNTNGKNYLIQMVNNGNILSLDSYDALTQIQEYSSIQNWVPVQSLCITTTTIPVYPENVANPDVYEPKQFFNSNSSQSLNIITNFSVDLDQNPTGYLPHVTYYTTNQYRFVDLMMSSSLSNIDLQVFWRDQYDILHPLYLYPQSKAHFDVVFINRNKIIN